jgi:LuxR family transcriptional regulator, maltose regulon positive regulatory protein
MESQQPSSQTQEAPIRAPQSLEYQLLSTKFFVPVPPGPVISRPRLDALLDQGLEHSFTLVSAPAGFGKTTLLSTWMQSQLAHNIQLCWLSLDEEDNDPRLFWIYVVSALHRQKPERFEPLLMDLQSSSPPSLKSLLATLINLLAEERKHFVLILDDYQVITEEQVHTTLAYLVEHLPAQLHIMLATRADPPLPLPLLRARQVASEVRTDQLRCTVEETGVFFQEVMGVQLPDETVQEVTNRTEGWLVGLHLLGLSLDGRIDPATLLEQVSGEQRYILDYLTEVVLQRQPPEVQLFLLGTSILEQLSASLCDAVLGQTGSRHMLEWLEQTNLFVVPLDIKREWYRYHALFAEALRYQLERTHADLVPVLHHRASRWYTEHDQTTEAIIHAFKAREWEWAAELIERKSFQLMTFSWGVSQHQLASFQYWVKQLPTEVMGSRPRLCLACAYLLSMVAPYPILEAWFEAAEASLTTSLGTQTPVAASQPMQVLLGQQEQQDLLTEVIIWRATLRSLWEDYGPEALSLCQQVLVLVSPENALARARIAFAQFVASYVSSANDAVTAIESGLQVNLPAQAGNLPASLAITFMASTALCMIGTGQLHEAQRLIQQATHLSSKAEGPPLPEVGGSAIFQAEILREWNQLKAARTLAEEALSLCQQSESIALLPSVVCGYAVLLRIALSCGELHAAREALQELERLSKSLSEPVFLHFRSFFTIGDQVRLWLACGELEHATRWVEMLDLRERHGTPLACEREEIACARVYLATGQPNLALQRLGPVLQRATEGKRWGHVIEIRLLQALAYQMHHEQTQALSALSEAIYLAEPEGYIRSFVDEGVPMGALLSQLRQQQCKAGPTPYLDTLLAAFPQQSKAQQYQPKHAGEHAKVQPLLDPLSEREREVLQVLARGVPNQEIAQELVIALDTVKRHVTHIFAKLGVQNRVQAIRQAQMLGLLDDEP